MTAPELLADLARSFSVTGDIRARAEALGALAGCTPEFDALGDAALVKGQGPLVLLGGDDPTAVVTGGGDGREVHLLGGGAEDVLLRAEAFAADGTAYPLTRDKGERSARLALPLAVGMRLRLGPWPRVERHTLRGRGAGLLGLQVAAALALRRAGQGSLVLLARGRLRPSAPAALETAERVVLPVLVPGVPGEGAFTVATVPQARWSTATPPRAFVPPKDVPMAAEVRRVGLAFLLVGIRAASPGEAAEAVGLGDVEALAGKIAQLLTPGATPPVAS